jgi:hypothetical protein
MYAIEWSGTFVYGLVTWCRTNAIRAFIPTPNAPAPKRFYVEVGFARSLLAYELPDGRS